MHRWRVGDAEIVRVEDSSFALPTAYDVPAWMVPEFAPTDTEIGLAFSAVGIAVDGLRIIVDPWLADDGPRDRPDAAEHVGSLLERLSAGGFEPDDVDLVINSHIDGIGWNTRPDRSGGWVPTFPSARHLFPQAELDALDAGVELYGGGQVSVLRDAGLVEPVVVSPHEVSPALQLVDAPGHNAGHVAVRVESGADLAVIPGHVILTPIQVDDPGYDAGDVDLALATETRRQILGELADRHGLLVTTLVGGPGGGRVERTGQGFALRPDHLA